MIWSVPMTGLTEPAALFSHSSYALPVFFESLRAFTCYASCLAKNSTSVPGWSPKRSRKARGMVICPLTVTFMQK